MYTYVCLGGGGGRLYLLHVCSRCTYVMSGGGGLYQFSVYSMYAHEERGVAVEKPATELFD